MTACFSACISLHLSLSLSLFFRSSSTTHFWKDIFRAAFIEVFTKAGGRWFVYPFVLFFVF